jgi:membrane protein YqaA with SNARE-associated domain
MTGMKVPARMTLLIVITLLIPLVPFAVVGELPGERWLSATGNNALLFGLTGSALLAADVLLPIPSSIVGTLLGARLGFMPGWACAWIGLVVGNLAGYVAGRILLTRLASAIPQTPTSLVLFVSRPVPVLAEAVTFAAGAVQMPLMPFLGISAAGSGLYALALAGNGAALLPDALIGPGLVIPMALPALGWLVWRRLAYRRRHSE